MPETHKQIAQAFDQLQADLEDQIQALEWEHSGSLARKICPKDVPLR